MNQKALIMYMFLSIFLNKFYWLILMPKFKINIYFIDSVEESIAHITY